jgi:hypothetical protein
MLTGIEYRNNIWMGQGGDSASLLLETAQPVCILGKRLREDLYGHIAAQARIAGAIHFAHPACTNGGLNLIRAKFCTGTQGHAWRNYMLRQTNGGPCGAIVFVSVNGATAVVD